MTDYRIAFDSAVVLCEDLGANLENMPACLHAYGIAQQKVDKPIKVKDINNQLSGEDESLLLLDSMSDQGNKQLLAIMYIVPANQERYGFLQNMILNISNKEGA